jgi:hypothetical protein
LAAIYQYQVAVDECAVPKKIEPFAMCDRHE